MTVLTCHKHLSVKTSREKPQIHINKHAFAESIAVPMRDA